MCAVCVRYVPVRAIAKRGQKGAPDFLDLELEGCKPPKMDSGRQIDLSGEKQVFLITEPLL